MTSAPLPEFDTPQLARTVETLSPTDIDKLSFGVIRLDADDVVRIYNRTEAAQSGYGTRPSVGTKFFIDVAPCMNNPFVKGRIDQARAAGTLDISFSFVGDYADTTRELDVKVQSAEAGGIWIFIIRRR